MVLESGDSRLERGRYCPGRGSLRRKGPEAGKPQGMFFLRHKSLKLEKTLWKSYKHD